MSARRPHQIGKNRTLVVYMHVLTLMELFNKEAHIFEYSANANGASQETLEEENSKLEEMMAHKVSVLKSVSRYVVGCGLYYLLSTLLASPWQLSIDMGDEVRGQNKFLGTMVGSCLKHTHTHTHTHTSYPQY